MAASESSFESNLQTGKCEGQSPANVHALPGIQGIFKKSLNVTAIQGMASVTQGKGFRVYEIRKAVILVYHSHKFIH